MLWRDKNKEGTIIFLASGGNFFVLILTDTANLTIAKNKRPYYKSHLE
jgi:hypothetical protein